MQVLVIFSTENSGKHLNSNFFFSVASYFEPILSTNITHINSGYWNCLAKMLSSFLYIEPCWLLIFVTKTFSFCTNLVRLRLHGIGRIFERLTTLRSHGTVQYFALFTLACVAGGFWCAFFFVVRKVRVTAARKVYRGRNRKRKNKKKTPATQTIFTEKFEHFSVLNISSQCFFLQLKDSVYLKLNQKRDSCLNKRISLSVHYINFPSTFSLWLTKAFVHMSHHLKPWQR